jgi:hypothetical protein
MRRVVVAVQIGDLQFSLEDGRLEGHGWGAKPWIKLQKGPGGVAAFTI